MPTATPRIIRTAIGPKILEKATELFDQSIETVFSELIQNARRAKATNIRISLTAIEPEKTIVVMHDDGIGVADPQDLLTFGGSGWNLDVQYAENAAGMGFFALGAYGATVASRDWVAAVPKDAFSGKEDVVVRSATPIEGTTVTFVAPRALSYVATHIHNQGRSAPLTICVNGQPIPQEDFLAGALSVTEFAGVRIGIYRGTARHNFFHNDDPRKVGSINFFGRIVYAPSLPEIKEVAPHDPKPRATSHVYASDLTYGVAIDIVDAPDLRLVLPARNKVIENDAFHLIASAAERAILEYLAAQPHQLAHKDFLKAKALGIDIKEPTIHLYAWTQPEDFFTSDGDKYLISVPGDADNSRVPIAIARSEFDGFDGHTLEMKRALSSALDSASWTTPPAFRLADDGPYEGYRGYDTLPSATLSFELRRDAELAIIDNDFESAKKPATNDNLLDVLRWLARTTYHDPGDRLVSVDSIDAVLTATFGDVPTRINFPIIALALSDNERDDGVTGAVMRTESPKNIAYELSAQTWSPNDDDDSDTKEYCENRILEIVEEHLLSSFDARLRTIARAADNLVFEIPRLTGAPDDILSITIALSDSDRVLRKATISATFRDGTTRAL